MKDSALIGWEGSCLRAALVPHVTETRDTWPFPPLIGQIGALAHIASFHLRPPLTDWTQSFIRRFAVPRNPWIGQRNWDLKHFQRVVTHHVLFSTASSTRELCDLDEVIPSDELFRHGLILARTSWITGKWLNIWIRSRIQSCRPRSTNIPTSVCSCCYYLQKCHYELRSTMWGAVDWLLSLKSFNVSDSWRL